MNISLHKEQSLQIEKKNLKIFLKIFHLNHSTNSNGLNYKL